MTGPDTVDAYLATLPPDRRAAVGELRKTITAAAPDATETIAYDMPALRSRGGKFLVSYAAYKKHYSLFPASDAVVSQLGDEIKPYLTGKGTIHFKASEPLPLALVTKVIKIRVAENAESAFERLIESGRMTRPTNPDTSKLPPTMPSTSGISATESLLAERRADPR